jgi:hypothetical protein
VADITADVPSAAVHAPLYAKALVGEAGPCRAVIIALDLIGASEPLVASIRGGVKRELGIDGSHVLINASHNHHTQGQVAKDLTKRIVAAVRRAAKALVPVRLRVGVGQEDRIAMNRRLDLRDGRSCTIRRANPSPADASVVGLGPLDAEIGVLRLDRLSGKPPAVVYNYALHAYGGVPDGRVTADQRASATRFYLLGRVLQRPTRVRSHGGRRQRQCVRRCLDPLCTRVAGDL